MNRSIDTADVREPPSEKSPSLRNPREAYGESLRAMKRTAGASRFEALWHSMRRVRLSRFPAPFQAKPRQGRYRRLRERFVSDPAGGRRSRRLPSRSHDQAQGFGLAYRLCLRFRQSDQRPVDERSHSKIHEGGIQLETSEINGQIGVVVRASGQIESVVTIQAEGRKIRRIYIVRNPDKLALFRA